VTQPSQKRYTEYFKTLFLEDRLINYQPIHLVQIALTPMPYHQTFGLEIFDSVNNGKLIYNGWCQPLEVTEFPLIKFKINTDVRGDLYCRVRSICYILCQVMRLTRTLGCQTKGEE